MPSHDSRQEIKIKYDRETHSVRITPETLAVKSGSPVRWICEGGTAQIVLPGPAPVILVVEPENPVSVLAGTPGTLHYGVILSEAVTYELVLAKQSQSTRASGMAVLIIYP
jgi:hypothetical protein